MTILSIDTWDSPAQIRRWLEQNPHDMEILLDDGYAEKAAVNSFPTTWFLDRAGRLQYWLNGYRVDLVEEDSWIIEELKRR